MKEILYDYFTNIDISGHKGQAIRKGVKFGPRRPIEDYLNGNIKISSLKLKIRLIKDGFFTKQCSHCKLHKWIDQDIPLELHHIDGVNSNNKLENLCLLCPNCHALTENYRGKNKKQK